MKLSPSSYPGPWCHPIPLHPAFVKPLAYEPLQPENEDPRQSVTLLYTRKEKQWWVASDRHRAAAHSVFGGFLKPGTLEPDPERCEIQEAEDLESTMDPVWEHSSQPRLLAGQAWLDWEWVRLNHDLGEQLPPRDVKWWSDVYETGASLRTIERAKSVLRLGSRSIVEVVWQQALAMASAMRFIELCPDRHTQKMLIDRYDTPQAFSQAFMKGLLPLYGMLPIRIENVVKQAMLKPNWTDAMVAESIFHDLELWKLERESMPLIRVHRDTEPKRLGRRPRKRVVAKT